MYVGNKKLDKNQIEVVKDTSKRLLVAAGAGSGKTLTILGKIKYLTTEKNIKENEILCISFTNAASNSLKEKINKELNLSIEVYTFHKLALNILKNKKYEIAIDDTLDLIIDEVFEIITRKKRNIIYKYLKVKHNCECLKKNKEIKSLKKLISTFIHLFKASNYKLDNFISFLKKIKRPLNIFDYKNEKQLLIIILNVYLYYTNYLKKNHQIDFDDMLILANKEVKNEFNKQYKYIIIDEFQDTSKVRFDLILSILNKTNASLMVVGDDFQSIYKFTGCNLDLFINFIEYFKDAKILKLENTYRNSNELINVAGSFIMKNKAQLKKDLKSNKHLNNPIEIVYFKNLKNDFINLITKIYNETNKPILILGRNNNDIYKYINDDFILNDSNLIYKINKDIKLSYLSIHKSKGLEEENVIVLNNIDDTLGFPNKITNNRILRLVSTKTDNYPFSEERRLFYVALTRTKNKIYLVTEKNKESIFIKEILKYNKYINVINLGKVFKNATQGQTIRYIKRYNDNNTYVVEVVPDNSNALVIKTMWKKPSTLTNSIAPSSTSKTIGSDISSTYDSNSTTNRQNSQISGVLPTNSNMQNNRENTTFKN